MKDVVCIYSGGMDSYTMVGQTLAEGRLHSCLSFDYGQRHAKELLFARRVCMSNGVPHHIIDLQSLKPLLPGSALTDDTVPTPTGHYAEENMKLTVVPNRNMIMLAIASGYAMAHKLDEVRFGAHAGDHTIYPDCREEFIRNLARAIRIADWHEVDLIAPFINLDKAGILALGLHLGLKYENSWTCYAGGARACGTCGSCQERLEAFARNSVEDPLEYVTRELIPKERA